MTAAAPTAPLPLRLLRWFWVPATPEASSLDADARARARAARTLVLLGEHGLARGDLGDGPLDPAAACAAAIANFRAALALGLPDARGVDDVRALLDGPTALEADPRSARLRRVLADAPMAALSASPEGTLLDEATRAGAFTRAALDPLLRREASRTERLRARFTRMTLLVLSLLVVAAVGPGVRRALRTDLGPTSRWRASTTMGPLPREGVGFRPREGEGTSSSRRRSSPSRGSSSTSAATAPSSRSPCRTDSTAVRTGPCPWSSRSPVRTDAGARWGGGWSPSTSTPQGFRARRRATCGCACPA
ncbi:MAG: hypothetical protein U0325_17770 [Polyangiales bacterium]